MINRIANKIRDDHQFKKYITGTALLIIALVLLFTFFYIRDFGKQAFVFEGEVFSLDKVSAKKMTLLDKTGETLVVTKTGTISLMVQYKGNSFRFGGGYNGLTGAGYTFSDGTQATFEAVSGLTAFQQRETRMISALRDYFGAISLKYKYPAYYVTMLLMVITVVLLAMYMLVYPEVCLQKKFANGLFCHGGKPTEFALFMSKIGGMVAIAASVMIFFSMLAL